MALVLLARLGVWQGAPYLLVLVALWAATVRAGLHASIAGMLAGLLVAAVAPRRDAVEGAALLVRAFRQSPMASVGRSAQRGIVRAVPVNERLQDLLHPWASYLVVPLFALANAGVDLRGGALGDALHSPVTWGVVLALVAGKLIGITTGTTLAVRLGLGRLPRGVGPGSVVGAASLSGIGFTIALLVVGLAFDDPVLQAEAAIGVLMAGAVSVALGWVCFRLAAVLLGERTADLPRDLSVDVDPDRDHIRGPVDARVTLVEYLDFECPFCAKATGVAKELRLHFGDDLRHVVRHLPLPDVHPHAELAALAAEAAGAAGQVLGDARPAVPPPGPARARSTWWATRRARPGHRCVRCASWRTRTLAARVRADVAGAEDSGARGTPTFFVGRHRHEGPHDAASLIAALEALRAGGRPGREGAGDAGQPRPRAALIAASERSNTSGLVTRSRRSSAADTPLCLAAQCRTCRKAWRTCTPATAPTPTTMSSRVHGSIHPASPPATTTTTANIVAIIDRV